MAHERHASSAVLVGPLVVQLVDDEDAILVAQFNELSAVGVVAGAYVVDAKLLHQLQALLDGTGIGGSSQRTEGMVVGIALQQHLLAVELHAVFGTVLHSAYAEVLAVFVGYGTILAQQGHLGAVEVRRLRVPQLGIGNLHLLHQHLLGA